MAGTKSGGAKTVTVNNQRTQITIDGKTIEIEPGTFYSVAGSLGGKAKVPKGFAINRELARTAGAKGGKISRRTK